jgi:hypothetical protein
VEADLQLAVRGRLDEHEAASAAEELRMALADLNAHVVAEVLDVGAKSHPQGQKLLLVQEELVEGHIEILRHTPLMPPTRAVNAG